MNIEIRENTEEFYRLYFSQIEFGESFELCVKYKGNSNEIKYQDEDESWSESATKKILKCLFLSQQELDQMLKDLIDNGILGEPVDEFQYKQYDNEGGEEDD